MTPTSREPVDGSPSAQQIHDVLRHPTRRHILEEMAETNRRGGEVYDPEDLKPVGQPLDDFRVTLYHLHLPKLADVGLIEWDQQSMRIEPGPHFDAYQSF